MIEMQFKKGLDPDIGCDRWDECPHLAPRCCMRCEQPCKKCTVAEIWFRQSSSWMEKECDHLRPAEELVWRVVLGGDQQ